MKKPARRQKKEEGMAEETRMMRVEVQFRTIAMDFWASLEHKLKYKKDVAEPERIASELKECADVITEIDYRMQQIRHKLDTEEDVRM